MKNYVEKIKHEDLESLSVCFYIEDDRIIKISDHLNQINKSAYMNGYNWEALLKSYLEVNHPEILEEMDTDPEAGMYVAYYKLTPENEARADEFIEIIEDLIENENKLYDFVTTQGEKIEWD